MQSFKDGAGNTWILDMTWARAERIYKLCERHSSTPENRLTFDFFNMGDESQAAELILSDPETGRFRLDYAKCLVNVLYVLCEDQCRERGVSDSEFGEMMTNSTFNAAYHAMMEELVNFIPNPERQAMFRKILTLAEGAQTAVLAETNRILDEKLNAMTAQITKTVREKAADWPLSAHKAAASTAIPNTTGTK